MSIREVIKRTIYKNAICLMLLTAMLTVDFSVTAYGADSENAIACPIESSAERFGENAESTVTQLDGAEQAMLCDDKAAFAEEIVYLSGKTLSKKLEITGLQKGVHATDWNSSNHEIASVDPKGKVTARGEGFATITAKVGARTLSCTVCVMKLQLSRNVMMAEKGETFSVSMTGIPAGVVPGAPIYHLEWRNAKPDVVQLQSYNNGTLYLKALAPGKSELKCVYNKTIYKLTVCVTEDLAKAANFREIRVGKIKAGRLFRSTSPVEHTKSNFSAADRLLGENHVRFVVNMTTKPDRLAKYQKQYGNDSPNYYTLVDQGRVWAKSLNTAYSSSKDRMAFVEAAKNIAHNEGPYLIHCRIGRDRTGFLSVLLEGLCGATVAEMEADYMKSWYNYNGIEPGTSIYNSKRRRFTKMLRAITKEAIFAPEETIQDACKQFCVTYGMTEAEVNALIANLCKE